MPSLPLADCAVPNLPGGDALFSAAGQALLREAVEERLTDISGVWKMRLLARDLIAALAPAMERVLQDAGFRIFSRRVLRAASGNTDPALSPAAAMRNVGSLSAGVFFSPETPLH